MGNRAIITYRSMPEVCIYVHWHGDFEDIRHFVESAKIGARSPGSDQTYSFAALAHAVTNAVYETTNGEKMSVGIGLTSMFDERTYFIEDDWSITKV